MAGVGGDPDTKWVAIVAQTLPVFPPVVLSKLTCQPSPSKCRVKY
ncbi:hypothetical protein RBSWK_05295 [Rhodopirellula baltica SWK14]|uniref:Uncharacterized protein n=1 Tax=Rhodopirellula baltica SWK14 TaxID=993516 RepID=L7CCE8_RHOBT|nr:hypothetical protein RBSWK_05295 [Rhodopirellula baltica SWK14]